MQLFENEIGCDCSVIVCESNKDDEIFFVHRAILMSSSPVFQAMFENDMQEKKNSEVKIEDIPSDAVKLMLDYIYGGVLPSNTFMIKLENPITDVNKSQQQQQGQQQGNVIMNVGDNEQKINLNHHHSVDNVQSHSSSQQNVIRDEKRDSFHLLSVGCALLCLSDKYRMNDLKHHCEYALHQLLNIDTCLHLLLASNRYNARRLRSVSLNYVSAHFQALSQSVKFKEFGDCNPSLLQEVLSNVTKEVQARPQKRLRLAMPNGGQGNGSNNSHKF